MISCQDLKLNYKLSKQLNRDSQLEKKMVVILFWPAWQSDAKMGKGREGKRRGDLGEREREPLFPPATQTIPLRFVVKDATYLLRFHSNVTSMLGVVQAHTRKTRYSFEHVYSSTSDSNHCPSGSTLYHWLSHHPLKDAGYLTIPARANCSDFCQHN